MSNYCALCCKDVPVGESLCRSCAPVQRSDLVERLRAIGKEAADEIAELRNRLVNLEDEKNTYIEYVGDSLGQDHDGESLWDAAQRVLSDRDRIRVERDELRAQIERTCTWQSDQDGVYSTECGHAFVFNDGTPEQNNQRFCGYCGGGLIVPAAPDDIYEALR